jgi:hypothetical protein
MGTMVAEKTDPDEIAGGATAGVIVGTLVAIGEAGTPWVDFPGNHLGPLEARSILGKSQAGQVALDRTILLAFENGNAAAPIILGVVQDTVRETPVTEVLRLHERSPEVVVDGRRLVLDASQEIVIRCGKSSITLAKDGRIIVKGTNLISRASRTNKIKGSTVRIN